MDAKRASHSPCHGMLIIFPMGSQYTGTSTDAASSRVWPWISGSRLFCCIFILHEQWKSECDNWLLVDKSSAPNFLSSCSKYLENWNLSLAFQFHHLFEPIPKTSLQDQPCAGAETACAKVLAATTRPLPNVPTSSCSEHLPCNKCSRLLMFGLQELSPK